ncbi:iron copper transporter (HMA, heavy metal-associated) [Colletotrichum tofieldiae]|uniref:Iron copper transporter (HMA, heavy metal-associated) n=1 Tax=Colletotrichum tofieldiae TaxID=708197 RepID=A0A166PJS9_9PEZI|nr:iron copper transporter (HMA, heavy metal-associated) [Colletotrichum tofieldiae]
MSEHTYKFNVSMSCGGCSGAVDRVLKKLDGTLYSLPMGASCPTSPVRLRRSKPTELLPHCGGNGGEQQAGRPQPSAHGHRRQREIVLLTCDVRTGVKSYEVSLESQTATVVAEESLPYEKVLQTIAKTGKKVNSGSADGVEQSVAVTA